jgi:hypothetical protein
MAARGLLHSTDAVLQALRTEDGTVEGLLFFGMDVTESVRSRSLSVDRNEP